MSRSVDLFIDADLPLDELAGALGRHVGSPFVAEPDGVGWRLTEGEVQAVLAEHRYRDDGDLPFSRYRFALSARLPNDVRPADTAAAALLRRVAQQIQRGPAWGLLLVHDLQYREHPVGAEGGVAADRGSAGWPAGAGQGPAAEQGKGAAQGNGAEQGPAAEQGNGAEQGDGARA